MKTQMLIIMCLFLTSCAHVVNQRSPSQAMNDFDPEAFGNFFQKVKTKSTQKIEHISKFEEILGRKIQVDFNLLDLPENSLNDIINKKNWSIEMATLNTESNSRFTNYILDISFGTISEKQFVELKKIMKSPNEIVWDPNKQYSIVDFMPISVQALYGNYYIHNRYTYDEKTLPWHYKFKDITNEGQVSRISNCWHAAWEYLQGANDNVSIFFADEQNVKAIFEDNQKSKIIKAFKPNQIEKLYSNSNTFFKDIKPGDLIMIYQKLQSMAQGEFEALAHVAIAVDNNIIFEKMNPSSNLPYRLAYLTDSIDNLIHYEKSNFNDKTTAENLSSLRIVVRRFYGNLPPLSTQVNMKIKPGTFLDISELKLKERPTDKFMMNHTIVSEFGTGGNISSEDLYKIQNVKIIKKDGKYKLENRFSYP